jgi:hypothetical protein
MHPSPGAGSDGFVVSCREPHAAYELFIVALAPAPHYDLGSSHEDVKDR